jgi:hypothetical protein
MNDIIEYKNKNSSKDFISEDKAIKYNHDSPYYSCGILSKIIKNSGINVAIERKSSNPQLTNLLLEWISFGFTNLRVLDVHLDLGKESQEILNDEEKRKDFIKNWIPKIIKGLSINENESQLISLYSGSLGARIAYNQNVPIDPQLVQNLRKKEFARHFLFRKFLYELIHCFLKEYLNLIFEIYSKGDFERLFLALPIIFWIFLILHPLRLWILDP